MTALGIMTIMVLEKRRLRLRTTLLAFHNEHASDLTFIGNLNIWDCLSSERTTFETVLVLSWLDLDVHRNLGRPTTLRQPHKPRQWHGYTRGSSWKDPHPYPVYTRTHTPVGIHRVWVLDAGSSGVSGSGMDTGFAGRVYGDLGSSCIRETELHNVRAT